MPATIQQSEKQYITRAGDTVDLICWGYYGRTDIATEMVLRRNRPLLSMFGAVLPAGLLISLPVLTIPVANTFQLWNYRPQKVITNNLTPPPETLDTVEQALQTFRDSKKTA